MKEHRKEFYQMCLDKWGKEYQARLCIEEMSELTKELCKYYRYVECNKNEELMVQIVKDIKEEIADALNMLEQVQMIFGADEIEAIREEKIKRTLERKFTT